jgi:hypothetical protein
MTGKTPIVIFAGGATIKYGELAGIIGEGI